MKLRIFIMMAMMCASSVTANAGESASDAWQAIVSKKMAKRAEFAYVKNNPDLPNVLLYGDSISIGYTQRVRKQLEGKANVYRLHTNGNHSGMFIKLMTEMHETMRNEKLDSPWRFQWDVIHFNVGLHDLKYVLEGKGMDKENGKQVNSTETYKKNLQEIIAHLGKEHPKAQLTFATTTPVPKGGRGRFAGDAAKYNTAALEVMKDHPQIAVNDLFNFVKPNQPKWWTKAGNVHYNGKGNVALGDKVAETILKAMAKKGGAEK